MFTWILFLSRGNNTVIHVRMVKKSIFLFVYVQNDIKMSFMPLKNKVNSKMCCFSASVSLSIFLAHVNQYTANSLLDAPRLFDVKCII